MDNYRQEKLGEVEDTFRNTSLSQEKIEEIGEWYILEIEKLKKKMKEAVISSIKTETERNEWITSSNCSST